MHTYRAFAIEIAREAGVVAKRHFKSGVEAMWKEDNTPVTRGDIEVNDLLIKRVRSAFPDHAVQGEEASLENPNARYAWVCDPIDGTMPYAAGIPMFAFSLALVDRESGLPVVAAVSDMMHDLIYAAVQGGGATCNDRPLRVSQTKTLEQAYVDVEASGYRNHPFTSLASMQALQEQGVKTFKLNSVVYGGVHVAAGSFAGLVYFKPHAHDVAALKLVVEEAGGRLTDLEGNERRYDVDGKGAVLSNGLVHDALLACVR